MNSIFTHLKNKISTLNLKSKINEILNNIKNNIKDNKSSWIILIIAGILVTAVSSLIFLKFQLGQNIPKLQISNSEQLEYWGQLGDFFGGILNPLLSFTALMAVLHSINMQRIELKLARNEVTTTNNIQRNQAKTFERQLFDTTFFGLLEAHRNILNEISIQTQNSTLKGRDALTFLRNSLKDNMNYGYVKTSESMTIKFEDFHKKHEAILGHYFRNLYHIIKLIDSYDAPCDENQSTEVIFKTKYFCRRQYSNFLRAQLSSNEVALLYSNCLTKNGNGLKPYVELYSMLKTFDKKSPFYHLTGENYNHNAFLDYEEIDKDSLYQFSLTMESERLEKMLRP